MASLGSLCTGCILYDNCDCTSGQMHKANERLKSLCSPQTCMFVTVVYITGARTGRNHVLVHIPAAGCGDLASSTLTISLQLQVHVHEPGKHHSRGCTGVWTGCM